MDSAAPDPSMRDPSLQIRQLGSPLTPEMLRPLEPRITVVQFDQPLTDAELKRVGRFMADYPDVRLRMSGYHNRTDLDWLRWFPNHRNFMVDLYDLDSLDGLKHLTETLTVLYIGETKKRLSLAPLAQFTALNRLSLERHTKDIEVLSELVQLERLTLRSITLPDLSILLPLDKLRSFDLKLGSTTNLDLLPAIGSLQYVEIWMVRGFDDLTPVSELDNLRYLFLQALRNITELPDLSRLTKLRRVHLETMKGIQDLSPLARAPALEELLLVNMTQLRPEDIEPLKNHPTLASIAIGLGSDKRYEAARHILRLPDAGFPPDDLYD